MDCNVIQDLIPLYIDDCCSQESAQIVKEHLENCHSCKELYESMSAPSSAATIVSVPKKLSRINDLKASILQSVLLIISFSIITVGVYFEAATPSGLLNGYWTLSLVVPATGFLLSLTNWYFVRLYKNRKVFSNCSALATFGVAVGAYIWAGFHYEMDFSELFYEISFMKAPNVIIHGFSFFYGVGIFLTAIFCVLSKILSNKYARMLGKE